MIIKVVLKNFRLKYTFKIAFQTYLFIKYLAYLQGMKTVLITGGSGMLGNYLTSFLQQNNYTVHWLSRKKIESSSHQLKIFQWDVEKQFIDISVFENVDYIIHLAGAGIADKPWTEEYKKVIIHSRVDSAKLLIKYIVENSLPIKKFIGASAVGIYGMKIDEQEYTEESAYGNDFLADVCKQWEREYLPLIDQNYPCAVLRIGLILSHTGGLYKQLVPIFKWGLGSALGSGKQYMPWIHIEDLCNMILYLMEHSEITGTFNATSGEYINNYDFSKKLAKSLNAPFFLPNIPEFLLYLIFGDQYKMLTTGLKISNQKIKEKGFHFKFENLDDALQDLKIKL